MSRDRWEALLDPKGLLLVGALLFLANGIGFIGDATAAVVLATWVTVVAAHFVYNAANLGAHRALRLGMVGATVALVAVPTLLALRPGDPLVDLHLSEGEHATIPEGVSGPVRVMVHAKIAGGGEGGVNYRISGLDHLVSGHLERRMGKARVAKRSVTESHVHDTELVSAEVSSGHEIFLEMARGAIDGPLHVVLFPERWPLSRHLFLGIALMLVGAVGWRRWRLAEEVVPVIAGVTVFGALSYRWLTPDAAFRPEVGALVVAAGMAAVASVLWRWVVLRADGTLASGAQGTASKIG